MHSSNEVIPRAEALANRITLHRLEKKEIDAERNVVKHCMLQMNEKKLLIPTGYFVLESIRPSLSRERLMQAAERFNVAHLMPKILDLSLTLKQPTTTLTFKEK